MNIGRKDEDIVGKVKVKWVALIASAIGKYDVNWTIGRPKKWGLFNPCPLRSVDVQPLNPLIKREDASSISAADQPTDFLMSGFLGISDS